MTTNQPNIIKASIDIDISLKDLWSLLTKKEVISRMTGLTVRTDIADSDGSGNGVLTIGGGIFFTRYSPYEAELSGTQAKVRLRAVSTGLGCRVAVAASLPKNSILKLSSERLQGFLNNLRAISAEAVRAPETDKTIELKEPSDDPVAEEYKYRGVSIEKPRYAPSTPRANMFVTEEEPAHREHKSRAALRRRLFRLVFVFVLLLIALSLAGRIRQRFSSMVLSSDASELVSLKSAKELKLGMSKNQIAFHLKTNGMPDKNNRISYRSTVAPEGRRPRGIISVSYNDAGRAQVISYLDGDSSISVYGIIEFSANITPDMSIEEAAKELGQPFSLYRRYNADDGSEMEEVHFGYLDPTANFDPAWRGEFEIIFNRTEKSVNIKNWGWYDGSDPTMIGSIENTPFANQYDDYTDFLNDRFQFSRSRLLLNGYSLGDTKYFFDGEPVHYSNDFGYRFFSVDSDEKLEDQKTPLYRISIGYDNNGAFQMASFSNMRLYNKTGTLKDSDYRLITRGMTYSEIRSLMRLIPTAMYIDSDFFSVCYGRFLNTDVADEQFEVIIRFDHETNHAQRVLINAAVSGVADAENSGNG
ncbi:MAG: hypothetical protein FWE66_02460 [Oscillospiraceae bacterium]|nr:hypothetical protein [Oscillospiraceae bacterium]